MMAMKRVAVLLFCLLLVTMCKGYLAPSKQTHAAFTTRIGRLWMTATALPPKVAVILVDHGSRKSEANNMLMEVASKYKELYNIEIVEAAHMELSEPSISTAFRKCVDQGAQRIICHPFFLSRGRHVQEDIPEMMRAAAAEHSDIELEYSITEPLGVQEKILELIHLSITTTAGGEIV